MSNDLAVQAPNILPLAKTLPRNAAVLEIRVRIRAIMVLASMAAKMEASAIPLGSTTAAAARRAADVFSHDNERPEGAELTTLKPIKDVKRGRLEEGVMRFYGAVGNTLCSTLWDPGSSINMITPAFAEELAKRQGLR
jgi:hypothetical protein